MQIHDITRIYDSTWHITKKKRRRRSRNLGATIFCAKLQFFFLLHSHRIEKCMKTSRFKKFLYQTWIKSRSSSLRMSLFYIMENVIFRPWKVQHKVIKISLTAVTSQMEWKFRGWCSMKIPLCWLFIIFLSNDMHQVYEVVGKKCIKNSHR